MAPIYTICGDNENIFTAGAEGVVRQWDVNNFMDQPRPIAETELHEDSIWELAWNPVSSKLASSSSDGWIKIIKIGNNALVADQDF